jgi:hypothetical protein
MWFMELLVLGTPNRVLSLTGPYHPRRILVTSGHTMIRERALKVVLVAVGLLFLAGLYPLLRLRMDPSEQMLSSIYVALGLFLLLASRDPSANRSLIAFTAWSSLIHAAVMAVQVFRNAIQRADLLEAVLPLVIVGVTLIVLSPAKLKGSWDLTARGRRGF